MIINKLFRHILLVLAFTTIFVCGVVVVLWFYSSKTVNASTICSHRLKYEIMIESDPNSDTYHAAIYLERQYYNLNNLYQIFSCALENRPAHKNYDIVVFTDKAPFSDGFSLPILPLFGIPLWDATYNSKEINRSIGTIEYRPILWLPFYYRTITINVRNDN